MDDRRERWWKTAGFVVGVLVPFACFLVDQRYEVVACGGHALLPRPVQLLFKATVGLSILSMLICLWQVGRSPSLVFLLGPTMFLGSMIALGMTIFCIPIMLEAPSLQRATRDHPWLYVLMPAPPLVTIAFIRWWWTLMRTRQPVTTGALVSVVAGPMMLAGACAASLFV